MTFAISMDRTRLRTAGGLYRYSIALALLAGAAPVYAQDSAPAEADGSGDTIIVTSLRRPEQLKDVAGSLTVFSAKDITRAGLTDLRHIADNTPNFGMLDNYRPGLERFQLRGIITPQVGDPPLAFVIDGVTAPDPEIATQQQLFDVERVEVLRGAQGALYGRSAVGGTVNIITRQPTNEFSGSASAAYENGDTTRLTGTLSGPIVRDSLYFRIGGYRTNSDGLIENVYLNRGADYQRDYGFSGMVKAQLGPDTSFDIRGQYGHGRDGIGYYNAVSATRSSLEDFSVPVSENVLGVNVRDVYVASAKLEHSFPFATLTVAGGYFHTRDDGVADGDLVALPSDGVTFFPASQRALDVLDAWTAEARLTSTGEGPFSWALGSFYQHRKKDSIFAVYDDPSGTDALTPAQVKASSELFSIQDNQLSRTWAFSAEASYKVTDALTVTAAGRYDRDFRRSVDPRDVANTFAKTSFDRFQPKISVAWHVTPDIQLFTGFSRGFRSGGFNQYSPVVPRFFAAEITDSYELGFQASALDGALSVRGALFRNDQDNAQITTFNPASFTLQNVAIDKVRAQGAELEIAASPVAGLHLRLSSGYTDSDIRAFTANPAVVGFAMPYVPEFTSAMSADYEHDIGNGTSLWGRVAWRMTGPRSYTLDFPGLKSRSHDFVDLRAGIEHGRWALTAYGENIFNEHQPEDLFGVFNGAIDLARQPNRPRRYGVELKVKFGSENIGA